MMMRIFIAPTGRIKVPKDICLVVRGRKMVALRVPYVDHLTIKEPFLPKLVGPNTLSKVSQLEDGIQHQQSHLRITTFSKLKNMKLKSPSLTVLMSLNYHGWQAPLNANSLNVEWRWPWSVMRAVCWFLRTLKNILHKILFVLVWSLAQKSLW